MSRSKCVFFYDAISWHFLRRFTHSLLILKFKWCLILFFSSYTFFVLSIVSFLSARLLLLLFSATSFIRCRFFVSMTVSREWLLDPGFLHVCMLFSFVGALGQERGMIEYIRSLVYLNFKFKYKWYEKVRRSDFAIVII